MRYTVGMEGDNSVNARDPRPALPTLSLIGAIRARGKKLLGGEGAASSPTPSATTTFENSQHSTPTFGSSLSDLLKSRVKRPFSTASSDTTVSRAPAQPIISSSRDAGLQGLERKMSRLKSPTKGEEMDVEVAEASRGRMEQEQEHVTSEASPTRARVLAFSNPQASKQLAIRLDQSAATAVQSSALVPKSIVPLSSAVVPLPVWRTELVPASGTQMVLSTPPGSIHLRHQNNGAGIYITAEDFKLKKLEQRCNQHLYDTKWAFPLGPAHGLDRSAAIRCTEFICKNLYGCEAGDCLHQLMTSDVVEARRKANARLETVKASRAVPLSDVTLANLLLRRVDEMERRELRFDFLSCYRLSIRAAVCILVCITLGGNWQQRTQCFAAHQRQSATELARGLGGNWFSGHLGGGTKAQRVARKNHASAICFHSSC